MPKTARYLMFSLLYFTQGAITAYFSALNSLYLLSFDISMSQIGLMGTIVLIPFVLKIFLGMLSDRVNLLGFGNRKPYILIGILTQVVCLIVVPFIHPGKHFGLFAGVAFLAMTGMALYDTCTDGYALDTTPPEEEGTIQGLMVGGRAFGVVIISAVLGILAETDSWQSAFWSLAAISLTPLPFVLSIQEGQRSVGKRFEWKAFGAFIHWPIIALGLLGALYSLVINGANQIINPFLQEQFNISYRTAGFITMVWGIGVVAGGVMGGRLVDRIGQRRAVVWATLVSIVSISLLAAIFSFWNAWLLVIAFGIAFGYYETVYFAISMRATDLRIAASMYSILMAIANLGTGIGLGLSGVLSDSLGFRATFVVIAVLQLLAFPLLPAIFGKAQQTAAARNPGSTGS